MCDRHTERPRTGCSDCHPRPEDTKYKSYFGGTVPAQAGQASSGGAYRRKRG